MCGFQRVADRVPHPGETGGIWAAFQEGGKLTKAKQEKEPGTMPPPALPLLPAVRLRFYIGYLNTKNAGGFLPEALSAMLTGTLDNFAGRMGSLLFKQGVDLNVLGQIIAYDTDIDEGEYQRLRGRAIRDMKRTNGRISFKDALDFQKSV